MLHLSIPAVEADRHLAAFDDDRDIAAAVRELEHALHIGRVLLDVNVLEIDASFFVVLTGCRGVASRVFAENQYFRFAHPLLSVSIYLAGRYSRKHPASACISGCDCSYTAQALNSQALTSNAKARSALRVSREGEEFLQGRGFMFVAWQAPLDLRDPFGVARYAPFGCAPASDDRSELRHWKVIFETVH